MLVDLNLAGILRKPEGVDNKKLLRKRSREAEKVMPRRKNEQLSDRSKDEAQDSGSGISRYA